ncbi:glycoside hydrolase [Exidia glandulosa HHB12029]|uniref:glucan 1,3-beta-glucosidase n=1 Tax=Exidia glandulosa HHB12029 TaxID=1314781 RepID=A0A165D4S8_EXIGL|nr:glycoside hydrolase [Exidia glandulosa HHB12029]
MSTYIYHKRSNSGLAYDGYTSSERPSSTYNPPSRQATMSGYQSLSARAGYSGHTPTHSVEHIPMDPLSSSRIALVDTGAQSKYRDLGSPMTPASMRPSSAKRRRAIWIGLAVVVLAIVIALIVYVVIIKPHHSNSTSSGAKKAGDKGNGNGTAGKGTVFFGTDGTQVKTEDGKSFTYKNPFGGHFVVADGDPYHNGAKAQSWSPALNESWKFGVDKIFGVNLGGWLVPEPFIVPALYEKYKDTDPDLVGDEWTLSQAMAKDQAGGGLSQLENHYKTFITEEDFANIAGAGLNWIRLPIPYHSLGGLMGDEPFLANVSWTYMLKAFSWARKYGIRINIDLHTVPGSQNGNNHSGKFGHPPHWMDGVMGLANAQRTMNYIRMITEFVSQDQYKNLVPIFGVVNEPWIPTQGLTKNFYLEAYKEIRRITGIGEGKGPYISIHDAFAGPDPWRTFLNGADRLALDLHPYFTFGKEDHPDIEAYPAKACTGWAVQYNASLNNFGFTFAGEWSLGFNDCGQWIWGLTDSDKPYTTNCEEKWNDWTKWDDATKAQFLSLAKAHMDSLANFFFWTWKIGESSKTNRVMAPMWSYSLGLEQGWIPSDPRLALGECARLGAGGQPDQAYVGHLQPWQTGGQGAGTFKPEATAGLDWPPPALATIANIPVPTYTQTGAIQTPPVPTCTPPPSVTEKGWANPQDTVGVWVPKANCQYPDPWNPGDVPPAPC